MGIPELDEGKHQHRTGRHNVAHAVYQALKVFTNRQERTLTTSDMDASECDPRHINLRYTDVGTWVELNKKGRTFTQALPPVGAGVYQLNDADTVPPRSNLEPVRSCFRIGNV